MEQHTKPTEEDARPEKKRSKLSEVFKTPAPPTPARPTSADEPKTPARESAPERLKTPERDSTPGRDLAPARDSTTARDSSPARDSATARDLSPTRVSAQIQDVTLTPMSDSTRTTPAIGKGKGRKGASAFIKGSPTQQEIWKTQEKLESLENYFSSNKVT